MRHDTRTVEELEREIRYFEQQATLTRSEDRLRRYVVAIATRRKALEHVKSLRRAGDSV